MIDFGFGATLRPFDSPMAGIARLWRNEPKIRKWCRQQDLISDQAQAEWYERQEKDPSVRMYGIADSDNLNAPAGVCGLTSIDWINRRAEFSLYIAPMSQGAGLGKKALQTLLSHGFENLGLHQIWGESFDKNPAMKTFDALGFSRDGVRPQFYFRDGKFVDAHLFSMLASDWREKCSKKSPLLSA